MKLCCFKYKEALLVLIWTSFVTTTSYGSTKSLLGDLRKVLQIQNVAPYGTIALVTLNFLPLAGILADICVSRFNVSIGSIWIAWLGSILGGIGYTLKIGGFKSGDTSVLYIFSLLLLIAATFSLLANSVLLFVDQLQDSSSDGMSFLIYLYYSIIIAGMVLVAEQFPGVEPIFTLLPSSVCQSLFLCLHYCFTNQWFKREPRSAQPYTTILGVVNFARKHKYPLRRSALTYWEEELPSRIDLAKTKYGGPYTNEQVEDVKTVLQLLKLMLPIFITNMVFGYSVFTGDFRHHLRALTQYGVGGTINIVDCSMVICLPLCKFIIQPLLRRCIPGILGWIGIAMAIGLVGMASLLLTDATGHVMSSVACMFVSESKTATLPVNGYTLLLSRSIVFFGYAFLNVATVEFIFAQIPQSMKGIGIGCFHLLFMLSILISYCVTLPFSYVYKSHPFTTVSCGSVYYLTNLVVGTIGLLLFILVARKYKYRQRDEVINTHMFAEEYYSKYEDEPQVDEISEQY